MTKGYGWILGALVVLSLVLAACGGADEELAATPTAPPSAAIDIDPAIAALLPSDPAALDGDFRADSAQVVGATGRPQLLEFFTFWCPTCNGLKPIVHGLEAEYWGEVDFVYLDREAGANSDLVSKFGIFGQPVLIFVAPDGETIIKQWFGQQDAATLSAEFDAYLDG